MEDSNISDNFSIESPILKQINKSKFKHINGYSTKIEKVSKLMREILETINPKAKEEIINKTPIRFAESLIEFTQGYHDDLDAIIPDAVFDSEDFNDMIIVKDIMFSSICEHHLLPFFGDCAIGYIPKKKILGLSKFPRLVLSLSKKMQLQERLTKEIVDAINLYLEPSGVVVIINAAHSCMCYRGIKSWDAKTQTIFTSGCLKEKDNLDKFFNMLNR